ncbi:MAG: hypothetical protein OQJ95_03545 [Kangiella sp.]|jgi:hypothetical protein|nr:hypothetical protein [Kangiella sp.]MCW9029423.1 hypothetical protein [Kangiella sp.]
MFLRSILTVMALSLCATSANAGSTSEVPVTIDTENSIAFGNMVTARFSDNPDEIIGCGVRHYAFADGTEYSWGFCQARVEPGVLQLCSTTNPVLLDKMSNINDFSYISFGWDENDECTNVGFSTQSQYIPEFQDKKDKKNK